MNEAQFKDEEITRAIEALLEPDRFRDAERRVAGAAPQLQQVLASALAEGGWFDATHEEQVGRAAGLPDAGERITALRTLIAEEARIAMMVGVAVGWELARELER